MGTLICTLALAVTPAVGCNSDKPVTPQDVVRPPASAGHALVYHAGLHAVLLVNAGLGGMTSPPASTPTTLWKWTGQRWDVLDANGPPIRNLGGVAYDAERNVLVLYGGTYSATLSYDDTWEWRVAGGWEQKNVSGPGKRDHTEMAYDAVRKRVVLFGGQLDPTTFPSDTWEYDGTAWQQITPPSGPTGRVHHTLAYDPASSRVLLFGGGQPATGDKGDTWAWNGAAWTSAAAEIAPRTHAKLGLTSRGVILFGGLGSSLPTLLLQNSQWQPDNQPNAPGARYLTAMAYDPERNVTVLYGGGNPSSDALFADTWEYSAASGWHEIVH
jgi:hypothetical protein